MGTLENRLGEVALNVYPQSMFCAKIRKISKFFSRKFSVCKAEKFSVHCMDKFCNGVH